MADMKAILDGVLKVAETVGPLIVPGAPAAIAAGRAVIDLIDSAKATMGETEAGVLQAQRDEIEAKVNRHADKTIGSLG